MKEDKKILERIRKLLAMTADNGATENEIEVAMQMVQRLMLQHSIDNDTVFLSPTDIEITTLQNAIQMHEPRFWYWDLLCTIGASYSCRVYKAWVPETGNYYKIVGILEDREIVNALFYKFMPIIRALVKSRYSEYIVDLQRSMIERGYRKFTKKELVKMGATAPAIWYRSYIKGFLSGLSSMLAKDKSEFLRIADNSERFELMVVKKDALLDAYELEKLKLRTTKSRATAIDRSAYALGSEDSSETEQHSQLLSKN